MAGMVQSILEKMQLQVAVTESGEIGIKMTGQKDQILEIASSYWEYRRTKNVEIDDRYRSVEAMDKKKMSRHIEKDRR